MSKPSSAVKIVRKSLREQTAGVSDSHGELSRVERKRRDTRQRIITAAEVLMRSQPIDEVTIQDITDAADVGHGTFYLHFKSKYEVLLPIVEREAASWDKVIQRHMNKEDDAAVVLASSSRYMARVIAADPLWRWFLQHSGVPIDDMRQAVGRFGDRDFRRGLSSGRFVVPNVNVASSFLLGGFVSGLMACFDADDPEQCIDHMAEIFLRSLGLDIDEAERIAYLPLPKLR